jgi:DNA-binding transcriptional MerR regulator
MSETDSKPYYKIGEVCELTGTQPYVLRFWESEFPSLAPEKNRSGQRIYRQRDIELIRRIKILLYEREYTIAGARKVLESELWEEDGNGPGGAAAEPHTDPLAEHGSESGVQADSGGAGPKRAHKAHGERERAEETPEPSLPFRGRSAVDQELEAEVKNLRAKLAHAEAELRAILAAMERRNEH